MDEHDFAQGLFDLLNNALEAALDGDAEDVFASGEDVADECPTGPKEIMTYEEAGVRTRNVGLVVRMWGGEEFQVTVIRSK